MIYPLLLLPVRDCVIRHLPLPRPNRCVEVLAMETDPVPFYPEFPRHAPEPYTRIVPSDKRFRHDTCFSTNLPAIRTDCQGIAVPEMREFDRKSSRSAVGPMRSVWRHRISLMPRSDHGRRLERTRPSQIPRTAKIRLSEAESPCRPVSVRHAGRGSCTTICIGIESRPPFLRRRTRQPYRAIPNRVPHGVKPRPDRGRDVRPLGPHPTRPAHRAGRIPRR